MCSYIVVDWKELEESIDRDLFLAAIKQRLLVGEVVLQGFQITNGQHR